MIKITVQNEVYAYDMYHITKAFWPSEVYEQSVDENLPQLIRICVEKSCEGIVDVFEIEKNEVTKSEISGVKGFFDKVLGKENIDRDNGKDEK